MEKSYDLIVLGFGKAGKTIAMKRSAAGDRVALIERDPKMYGGTCINIGCVPTKKLLSDTAKGIEFPAAVEGRDTLIGKLNATNLKLAESKGVTVINGEARFSGSHEVTITAPDGEDLLLSAKAIIINTGATPIWPDLPGINGSRVYDSTSIQHITPTPKHLVIIGGGPIGLEEVGIELGERGEVKVDHQLRTSIAGVYAVGDVKGGPQFTYVSYDDHRIVLDHFEGSGLLSTEGRIIPTTTFLEPPLSTVGMGEQQAREAGHSIKVRKARVADMPIVPRPKILGQPEGMVKFITNADTGKILGATLFCVDSQELINTVAIAMRHGITASDLGRGIYTHPSTSEIFNQLLE